MSGSGSGCVECDPCLSRLCVTKDGGGRVTALSYWEDAETPTEVPDCGGVVTDCCPSDPVPATLHAVVTGGGSCDGTYKLTWRNTSLWTYRGSLGVACDGGGLADEISLTCFPEGWVLGAALGGPYGATSASCDPLSLTFTDVDLTPCGGTTAATVTVSP